MFITVTESNLSQLSTEIWNLPWGFSPATDNQSKDAELLKFPQTQFLTWQATLGFNCSRGEPNAVYALSNTSKGLAEATITYPVAFVKEQWRRWEWKTFEKGFKSLWEILRHNPSGKSPDYWVLNWHALCFLPYVVQTTLFWMHTEENLPTVLQWFSSGGLLGFV